MLCSVIQEFFIDFIGDDPEIMGSSQFRQFSQFFPGIDDASGVIGGVDDDGFGPGCDGFPDGFQIQMVPFRAAFLDRHLDWNRIGQFDHFHIADPAGNRDDDFIPLAGQGQDGLVQCLFGAGSSTDFIRGILYAVIPFEFTGNGFPQIKDPVDRSISGEMLINGCFGGHIDIVRRVEIRFTDVEPDHFDSVSFHIGDFGIQLRGKSRRYMIGFGTKHTIPPHQIDSFH